MTNQTELIKAFNILYAALENICNNAPADSPLEQQAGTALYKASKLLIVTQRNKPNLHLQVVPKLKKEGLEHIEPTNILNNKKTKLHLVV